MRGIRHSECEQSECGLKASPQKKTKVRAVIEAVNKISTASSVFEEFDEFLLHVIGYATVDVVNKCAKHRANVQ